MTDRTFEILINILSKSSGLDEANAKLAQLRGQTEQAGTASGELAKIVGIGVAGGLTAAGVAALGVYNHIVTAVQAERELNEEILRQNVQLDRVVTLMRHIAESARDLSAQMRIGDVAERDIDGLSQKLREWRIKEIDATSTWSDTIESLIRKALQPSPLSPFPSFISEQTFSQQVAAENVAAQQRLIEVTVRDTNVELTRAAEKTREWNAANADLPRGIQRYQQELAEAQARFAQLDSARQASPADQNILLAYQDQLRVVSDLQNKLDALVGIQGRLGAQTQRVADEIARANFDQLDPAGKLQAFQQNLLDIQVKLRAIGVEAASPTEAIEKTVTLTGEDAKQTEALRQEVIRLAGAWATVLAAMLQVVHESEQARQAVADQEAITRAYAYGTRDDAYKAEWGARYNKILEERRKIGGDISADSVNQQIYEEQLAEEHRKEWADEDRAAGATLNKHHELTSLLRQESDLLKDLRAQQQLVNDNPFLSADQKQSALHDIFLAQQPEILAAMDEVRRKMAEVTDPAQIERYREELRQLGTEYVELEYKIQTTSFGGELRSDLTNWVNSFGTSAHQVASIITGTLNTAIGSTSQAITGLIFGTKNWKQAFASAAQSIVQNIIQIALQWVVSKLIMAAIDRATGQRSGQAATQAATQAAAAWAPAAVSAAIASYGAAVTSGVLAYGAGVVAAEGIAIGASAGGGGGFKRGGFTGYGGEDEVAGPVHRREYVFTAREVDAIGGPNAIEALKNAVMQGAISVALAAPTVQLEGYQGGGYVDTQRAMSALSNISVPVTAPSRVAGGGLLSGGSGSSGGAGSILNPSIHIFAYTDKRELADAILNSDAHKKIFVDLLHNTAHEVGINAV